MTGPLQGVVVADFSRVLAGPYCTMLLGDLGADVIKVESPAGDDTRHWVPPWADGVAGGSGADGVAGGAGADGVAGGAGEVGTYYLSINRNKRSIVLDLTDAADLALAHRLTARADVTIQNFRPGGLDRFGLDEASVRVRRPDTVYCSISGFGSEGGAHLPGYDLLVQAVSGLMSVTGPADGSPYRSGVAVFDVLTGLHCAVGIIAALRHRDRTGEGQHVETDLLSVALSTMVNQTSAYVAGGVVPQRMGNAHPSLTPYEPLPTADGDLVIAVGNDAQFRSLVTALGVAELADDGRFATMSARNEHRDVLRPMLVQRLVTRSADEWFETLTSAGIPCGPINDVAGGIDLATRLGLQPVVDTGGTPTVRNPLRLSTTPARHDLAPPRLDQDSAAVRAWLADT